MFPRKLNTSKDLKMLKNLKLQFYLWVLYQVLTLVSPSIHLCLYVSIYRLSVFCLPFIQGPQGPPGDEGPEGQEGPKVRTIYCNSLARKWMTIVAHCVTRQGITAFLLCLSGDCLRLTFRGGFRAKIKHYESMHGYTKSAFENIQFHIQIEVWMKASFVLSKGQPSTFLFWRRQKVRGIWPVTFTAMPELQN